MQDHQLVSKFGQVIDIQYRNWPLSPPWLCWPSNILAIYSNPLTQGPMCNLFPICLFYPLVNFQRFVCKATNNFQFCAFWKMISLFPTKMSCLIFLLITLLLSRETSLNPPHCPHWHIGLCNHQIGINKWLSLPNHWNALWTVVPPAFIPAALCRPRPWTWQWHIYFSLSICYLNLALPVYCPQYYPCFNGSFIITCTDVQWNSFFACSSAKYCHT